VFRSFKKGDNLAKISPEITRTKRGSATALAESRYEPGVLYVGTDDGAMWMTHDGGHEWTKIIDFPDDEAAEDDAKREAPAGEVKDESKPDKPRAGSAAQRQRRASPPIGRGPGGQAGERRGRGPGRMIEMIKSMDANHDGKIQRDEVPERMQRMFERIDSNGDDVIDADELKAMADRIRGGRRGGPPPSAELVSENTPLRAAPPAVETSRSVKPQSADDPKEKQKPVKTAESAEKLADDPISGEWEVQAISDEMDAEQAKFQMTLELSKGGKVTGTMESFAGEVDLEGTYDSETGKILFSADAANGMSIDFEGKLEEARIIGEADIGGGMFSFGFEADRESKSAAADPSGDTPSDEQEVVAEPLTELLPGPRWVSSIETSHFDKDRVYVTLDGHRSDDDEPYLFASDDGGKTWRSVRGNLPTEAGSTRVLREDIENEDLLYLGCEFGAWVSIDRGKSWTRLNGKFPTVAVHEFAIHPTSGEVVLATHGRSLWVLDVTPLRQLSAAAIATPAKLFNPVAATYWRSEPGRGGDIRRFVGQNPPSGARIAYSLGKRARGISLKITDPSGETIRELDASSDAGLHTVQWDLRKAAPQQSARPARARRGRFSRRGKLVESGKYVVALEVDGRTYTQELVVETDPEHPDYRPWEMEQWELEFFDFEPEELESGVPADDGI